jgi:hypothetical protein
MTNQAKETVGQVADQAQQAAGQMVGQAREQVSSRLAGQKDRAAEGLTSVAQALRHTGQQLRDQDEQAFTGYIDSAASQVERISNYLRNNDLGQLVDDVERFARRQPALFLGGTFVLGLLSARFLKSSRPATAGSYTTGAPLAYRQQRYYTGYPTQTSMGAGPTYRSGMTGGPYSTSSGTTTQPSSSYGTGRSSTTTGSTTQSSSSYGTGPRTYDQRREE